MEGKEYNTREKLLKSYLCKKTPSYLYLFPTGCRKCVCTCLNWHQKFQSPPSVQSFRKILTLQMVLFCADCLEINNVLPCLFHTLEMSSWFPRSVVRRQAPWSREQLLYHSCILSGSSLSDFHSSIKLPSIDCWYPKPNQTLKNR